MQWAWIGDTLVGVRSWYRAEIVKKHGRYEWNIRVVNNPPFEAGISFNENDAVEDARRAFIRDVASLVG